MSGAMRLVQGSILVLWLSVFVCIGSVVEARKMFLAYDGTRDDKNNSMTTALETRHIRCKSKKLLYCCECFFSSYEKMMNDNNGTTSEEKRVVPTGPNPLHNK